MKIALMICGVLCLGAAPIQPLKPLTLAKPLVPPKSKRVTKARAIIEPCTNPLPDVPLPLASLGETVRYVVDVDGVSMGVVDFRTIQKGQYQGEPVTEYRSQFKLDSLLGSLVPVDGRAASLVRDDLGLPARAMNHYSVGEREYEETVTWDAETGALTSARRRGAKTKTVTRTFDSTARDFVTGFYALRGLPRKVSGCTIIYGNQRAYTLHLKYVGEERVLTPVGLKPADRYELRYAHGRSKKVAEATLWLGLGAARLPYRAEIRDRTQLDARIHLYEPGKPSR
ncbi:MAG: DUF3108 domain-containing protein [Myxococcota bacterium]|nr:DUF3108 domain-containing protein [Myxococcota bacterium]